MFDLPLIYELRIMRLAPEILDERIAKVVQGLRERKFLKGTVLEQRAQNLQVDPYSLLLGILIGMAVTVVLGALTFELWLPMAISRLTKKTLAETTKTVREILLTA